MKIQDSFFFARFYIFLKKISELYSNLNVAENYQICINSSALIRCSRALHISANIIDRNVENCHSIRGLLKMYREF